MGIVIIKKNTKQLGIVKQLFFPAGEVLLFKRCDILQRSHLMVQYRTHICHFNKNLYFDQVFTCYNVLTSTALG